MDDLISRQAVIRALESFSLAEAVLIVKGLPSVEPTLYGYKIEHLAYIARVMEKEGVTAEYAVRTFDDMSRAIKMIIDEAQEKIEETLWRKEN